MKAMCQARKGEETMVENAGKIGLVVEGGGMKCAYNAAILGAFLDEGIALPYCVGVSAGAGNLASYLAGQRGRTCASSRSTSTTRATSACGPSCARGICSACSSSTGS